MAAELDALKHKRYLDLKMGDSDLERLLRGNNQSISVVKTQRGEIGPWCFDPGRFQRGRVQDVIRRAEARPSDKATVSEMDLTLAAWDGAELKGVAADFYQALFLFCTGKAFNVVLTNKECEGFEAWRALVNKHEPTSKASAVRKLAEILRTPFEGDLRGHKL